MKTIRRILQILGLLFIGLCLYVFIGFTYMFYQESKSFAIGMKNVEGARIIAERNAKIDEYNSVYSQAVKYEKEGKYDLAIEEYKKAFNKGESEWMVRCGLADSYAKAGQHELALQEVDWIIVQNPREEVKNEYLIRKQLLEKLIEREKAVNVTNLDQTAFLLHRVTELKGN